MVGIVGEIRFGSFAIEIKTRRFYVVKPNWSLKLKKGSSRLFSVPKQGLRGKIGRLLYFGTLTSKVMLN